MKEAMDKWLAALRSGEYKQTDNALYREEEEGEFYCCLGVAEAECFGVVFEMELFNEDTDLTIYNVVKKKPDGTEGEDNMWMFPEHANILELDTPVLQEEEEKFFSLLDDENISDSVDEALSTRQATLTLLNDNNVPFPKIADVIESMGWHLARQEDNE